MSHGAIRGWAVDVKMSRSAVHVGWCLMLHGNSEGLAWPSVALIAAECRMNRDTVRLALRELERLGEIVRVGVAGNNVTIWQVPKPAECPRAGLSQARGKQASSPRKNGSKPAEFPALKEKKKDVWKGADFASVAESIQGARDELRKAGIRRRR